MIPVHVRRQPRWLWKQCNYVGAVPCACPVPCARPNALWIVLLCASVLLSACGAGSPTAVPPTATLSFPATETPQPAPTEMPPTPNPAFVSSLLGVWQGNNNSFYVFKKDGTWGWDDRREQITVSPARQGIWWIEGTVLNLVDSGGQTPCPQTQIGTYQMDYKNGVLLLGQLEDRCKGRGSRTQGMYHQLEKGQ